MPFSPPKYHHVGGCLRQRCNEAGEAQQDHEGQEEVWAAAAAGTGGGEAVTAHTETTCVVLNSKYTQSQTSKKDLIFILISVKLITLFLTSSLFLLLRCNPNQQSPSRVPQHLPRISARLITGLCIVSDPHPIPGQNKSRDCVFHTLMACWDQKPTFYFHSLMFQCADLSRKNKYNLK